MRITRSQYWTDCIHTAVRGDYVFRCLGCGETELVSVGAHDLLLTRGIAFNSAHQCCKRLVGDPEVRVAALRAVAPSSLS